MHSQRCRASWGRENGTEGREHGPFVKAKAAVGARGQGEGRGSVGEMNEHYHGEKLIACLRNA